MKRKFYIASGLENAANAARIRDALVGTGRYEQTYDWMAHGAVWSSGLDRIQAVALAELKGVADADFVIVVLPGARGTHTEMGYALALGKQVFIWTDDLDLFSAVPQTCAFYHHPNVIQCPGRVEYLYGAIEAHG